MSDAQDQTTPRNRTPQELRRSGRLSGSDMAVMTIVTVIAIICAAVYIVNAVLNPTPKAYVSSGATSEGRTQYEITTYTELPDGEAAVINDVVIPEDKVNEFVEVFRAGQGLDDEELWEQYVAGSELKNSDNVRKLMLGQFVNQELVKQAAAELGLAPTQEEVDQKVADKISMYMTDYNFDNEDEVWTWLEHSGVDKKYFESLSYNEVCEDKIVRYMLPAGTYEDDLDDEILAYIKKAYPARSDINSLDDVSDEVIESSKEYVIYYKKLDAYNKVINDFISISDISIAPPPKNLPYEVDSSAYETAAQVQNFKNIIEFFKAEMQATPQQ